MLFEVVDCEGSFEFDPDECEAGVVLCGLDLGRFVDPSGAHVGSPLGFCG